MVYLAEETGVVRNGYDPQLNAIIIDYIIQPCAHEGRCSCKARAYAYCDVREVEL